MLACSRSPSMLCPQVDSYSPFGGCAELKSGDLLGIAPAPHPRIPLSVLYYKCSRETRRHILCRCFGQGHSGRDPLCHGLLLNDHFHESRSRSAQVLLRRDHSCGNPPPPNAELLQRLNAGQSIIFLSIPVVSVCKFGTRCTVTYLRSASPWVDSAGLSAITEEMGEVSIFVFFLDVFLHSKKKTISWQQLHTIFR